MPLQPTPWPDLSLPSWADTTRTLHLWLQLVGKTRLALAPMTNHWWQVPLYVTARGLGTSLIPYGRRGFEIELDLLSSRLEARSSDGDMAGFSLHEGTLTGFCADYLDALAQLDVTVELNPLAVEVTEALFLDSDDAPRVYDPEAAARLHRALVQVDAVFKVFRGAFIGKASPVHFFWGAFNLAATRFSGRRAPPHPGGAPHVADGVMREAYSHEVSSVGFWPGGIGCPGPTFYSYAYPEPQGFRDVVVAPTQAVYNDRLREFLLPYDAVREASVPERALLSFCQSTYVAAAEKGAWARGELERERPTQNEPELHP